MAQHLLDKSNKYYEDKTYNDQFVDVMNVEAGGTGGKSRLSELNDVSISTPISDGQILKYDITSSKWINSTGNDTGWVSLNSTTGDANYRICNGWAMIVCRNVDFEGSGFWKVKCDSLPDILKPDVEVIGTVFEDYGHKGEIRSAWIDANGTTINCQNDSAKPVDCRIIIQYPVGNA